MSPPSRRLLRFSGIAVAVVLLGLAFYPGTLTSPYATSQDTLRYAHTIVPESSPQYEEYAEEHDPETLRYDELSPVARELFDRTKAAEPRSYDGERRYVPDVCRDFVLVCDTYSQDELPDEFTYGTELTYEEAFVFIEDGDDRYLLRTGITGHLFFGSLPVGFVTRWLTMLPLAAFVAVVTLRSESDRVLGGAVGGSAAVAALGFLAPYAEMAGLVSTWIIGVLLLGGVWFSIFTAGGYRFYQWITDREPRSPTDGP